MSPNGASLMAEHDDTLQTEGTVHVTDATLVAVGPAELQTDTQYPKQAQPYFSRGADADELPIWAASPTRPWNIRANLLTVLLVLIKPRSTFRRAQDNAWQVAVAVVSIAAILRAIVYFMYESSMDNATAARIAIGTAAGILSPLLFIAICAAVLYAINAAARSERTFPELLSFASLSAVPIVFRALIQTVAMGFNGEPVNPHGVIGLILPDAPTLLLRTLAPIDFFGLWAVALVVVAAFVVAMPEVTTSAEGPAAGTLQAVEDPAAASPTAPFDAVEGAVIPDVAPVDARGTLARVERMLGAAATADSLTQLRD